VKVEDGLAALCGNLDHGTVDWTTAQFLVMLGWSVFHLVRETAELDLMNDMTDLWA
jgi:hypothetical protein